MSEGSSRLPWWKQVAFAAVALAIGGAMLFAGLWASIFPLVTFANPGGRAFAVRGAPIAALLVLAAGLGLRRLGLRGFPVDDAIGFGALLVPWTLWQWFEFERA